MAFIIGGEGRRTAVASRGKNKEAPKLVIITDLEDDGSGKKEATVAYDVELIFATPRGSEDERSFKVIVENEGTSRKVSLSHAATARRILVPAVKIGKELRLSFDADKGQPVLSGVKLSRTQ